MHATIRAGDREISERFYDTVFRVLGKARTGDLVWGDFALTAGGPPTRRLHIAFHAPHDLVDAFHRTGVEAGYEDDGGPGPRPQYSPEYYGAFLKDPDGNSVEAVYTDSERELGQIDHVWLRVADVATSTAFYESVARRCDLTVRRHTPDHTQLHNREASFSVVTGEPTQHVQLAFAAGTAAALLDPDGNEIELYNR